MGNIYQNIESNVNKLTALTFHKQYSHNILHFNNNNADVWQWADPRNNAAIPWNIIFFSHQVGDFMYSTQPNDRLAYFDDLSAAAQFQMSPILTDPLLERQQLRRISMLYNGD